LIFFFAALFAEEASTAPPVPEPSLVTSEELTAFLPMTAVPPEKSAPVAAEAAQKAAQNPQDGYTINYTTLSILEYIRFASKICKTNFIYDETDLNFTITVVSDEPVTPQNVMATLLQVLRIHGLELLEQDNSLVIHKQPGVKQLGTVVTGAPGEGNAPIVTRIFRIKHTKAESIAAIIRPMISNSAIIEASPDTKQIILTDVTANVDKVAALIENLDSPHTLFDIKSYEAHHNSPEYLIQVATQIMDPIAGGQPFILVPQLHANAIYIVSTPDLVEKALTLFSSLDVPQKRSLGALPQKGDTIFVYKVLHRSGDEVLKGLMNIGANLEQAGNPDPDLIRVIDNARWNRDTNTIMIVGSKVATDQVKDFLSALDTPISAATAYADKTSFFVYKPIYRPAEEIEQAITEMAKNLVGTKGADQSLIDTINSVKINPSTHTLIFSGEEKNFVRIRDMLSTIDTLSGKGKTAVKNNFFIYKIQHADPSALQTSLRNFVKTLDKTNAGDAGLINAINGMKLLKENNSILFTGSDVDLKQIETLVPSFDVGAGQMPSSSQFFIYKPVHQTGDQLVTALKDITTNLKNEHLSDPALIRSLETMKWVKSTNSLMFTGDPASLAKVETLIGTVDKPAAAKPGYFIYKVQHTTGDAIEEDLDLFAKNLRASGFKDPRLLDVIDKMRYVKETNSLVLSGDPSAIEEVKGLIAQYDFPRKAVAPTSSNFFMYKPVHLTANQIEGSLHDIGSNLKKAGLADPNLLNAIESAKYVSTTNSLIFTGTPDALQKIQTLIKDIDVPPAVHAPIQHIGKTTFLLYKLKHANGPQIVSSLKAMTNDLKKTSGDKDLVAALNTMKYVKETNSLFFTGTQEALGKVQTLLDKFDVTGLSGSEIPSATNFFVYKPQSLPGPELEKIITDFGENLKASGLADPELFNAIASARWNEKTLTLVFTGTPKALDQVKTLLTDFDVPGGSGQQLPKTSLEPTIQAVDNISFLVYKLQFHKGDEIQGALRQIAKDLLMNNAPVNKNLLNSINSIQWLEVTNSLLASGDQETLTRLRELIKNLDIPLKQVFIEVLVIETNLTNALAFGLEWGANYKYRDKFATTMSNTAPTSSPSSGFGAFSPDTTMKSLGTLVPPTTPTTTMLPSSGTGAFDLGVIGEVIRHNGQTYLTLASLLQALQQDTETNVIDTPKILTQDGRTSSIFVGRNIPFVGSFVSNTTNSTINSTNIEYRDIGLNLTITPVLGNSDIVTLDINLDRSQTLTDVSQASLTPGQTANGIVTSKTTMQTTVHVPDDNFLILSGAVLNSNAKVKTGFPCLGGLPLVGALFSSNNDVISNTNIVIFIRPHIINSIEDMRTITTHEEEFFRDQAGTPFLERFFDNGMEMIKTPDDE
jgi:type II secretory pathway component GspD/PulD (secretin)